MKIDYPSDAFTPTHCALCSGGSVWAKAKGDAGQFSRYPWSHLGLSFFSLAILKINWKCAVMQHPEIGRDWPAYAQFWSRALWKEGVCQHFSPAIMLFQGRRPREGYFLGSFSHGTFEPLKAEISSAFLSLEELVYNESYLCFSSLPVCQIHTRVFYNLLHPCAFRLTSWKLVHNATTSQKNSNITLLKSGSTVPLFLSADVCHFSIEIQQRLQESPVWHIQMT